MAGKKFWEIKAAADGAETGEVYIYGDIVSDRWDDTDVTAADFKEDLDALGGVKTLNIYINSYGGSVFQGQAIYSILKRHKARKNVYVDGIAASIASLVAMAGDNIYMPQNAMMMIHNPWGLSIGNAQEMRKMADDLDKIREAMIPAYLGKVGERLTEKALVELLDAETWLTAQECFDYGFCDKLLEGKQLAASASPEWAEKYVNRYKNMPESLRSVLKDPQNGVVPTDVSRETAPEDTPWEAPSLKDFTGKDWDELADAEKRKIAGHFAWAQEMPPEKFGNLKLPHHRPEDGKVVWRGVTAAAQRLDQADIPEADVPKVRSHLASHYHQFGRKAPWESDDSAKKDESVMREQSTVLGEALKARVSQILQGVNFQ